MYLQRISVFSVRKFNLLTTKNFFYLCYTFMFFAHFISSLFLFFFHVSSALAEENHHTTQYVFIIDDSGSMGLLYQDNIPADPNRLAPFAARSMMMMLSNQDQISVIRLNGGISQPAKKGTKPVLPADPSSSLQYLRGNRKSIAEELSLENKIAAYAGSSTPCRAALDRAQDVLNRGYNKGVKQVVFFLTDGACEGKRVEESQKWLNGLRSYSDNSFKFFLLTFEGRAFSKELLSYTRDEDGIDIGRHVKVNANDPIGIIKPFTEALAFANGVEPIVLLPDRQNIPAHPAAAGVRLLSVDVDSNSNPIEIHLKEDGSSGSNLGTEKNKRQFFHQWEAENNPYTYDSLRNSKETGNKFKATALQYVPNTHVVWGEAINASSDWRIIAIPEYFLEMKTQFMKGDCSNINQIYGEGSNPRRGEETCILVSIHNHTSKNVTPQMVDAFPELRVEMKLLINGKKKTVTFRKIDNNQYFAYPLNFSELGEYKLTPAVQLLEKGLHLYGDSYTFSTYDVSIDASPGDVNFGEMHLSSIDQEKFEVIGAFKETETRFKVLYDIPNPCIDIKVNDKKEGEALKVAKGSVIEVKAEITPICGNRSFDSDFTGSIVLNFPQDEYFQGRKLKVPWKLHLGTNVGVPEPLKITLEAGQSSEFDVSSVISKIWEDSPIELDVVIAIQGTENLPKDLKVFYQGKEKNEQGLMEMILDEPGLRHLLFVPKSPDEIPKLTYEVHSTRCCDGGIYESKIFYRPNGDASAQVQQDLLIEIIPKSKFDCYWPLIKNTLIVIAILLFIAYIYNIFRKSHFIDMRGVENRFLPLVYKQVGSTLPKNGDQDMVSDNIRIHFRKIGLVNFSIANFGKWYKGRFTNWLKSNPLKFGLPGVLPYHECVFLSIDEDTSNFSSRFIASFGMRQAVLQPAKPENQRKMRQGSYMIANPGGRPKFVFIYNKVDPPDFRPKSIHNLNPNDEDADKLLSEDLENQRIYRVKYRSKKANESAGWSIEG